MTTVAIMQPQFLPRTRYMAMIDQADVFVLLDTVPVDKKSWQTRAQIRARDGNVVWISVPTNASQGMLIKDVAIRGGFERKMWRTLESAYAHTPGWQQLAEVIRSPILYPGLGLSTMNYLLIQAIADHLGITTPIYRASDMPAYGITDRIGRIAHILHTANATSFLATPASTFLHGLSHIADVPIEWFQYETPDYKQPPHAESIPNLSVLDFLAYTADNSLAVIRSGYAPEDNFIAGG